MKKEWGSGDLTRGQGKFPHNAEKAYWLVLILFSQAGQSVYPGPSLDPSSARAIRARPGSSGGVEGGNGEGTQCQG